MPLIQQNNPTRYQSILALEQHTQNYTSSVNSSNAARLISPNSTIIIPVVVHILHRGEAIGVGRNISVAQIQSQIDVLNEDFRRMNADRVNTPAVFQGFGADANFEFRLACIDPAGNPTTGITRTFAGVNQFNPLGNTNPSDGSFNEQAIGIKFTNNGGINAWATTRYLNIWVCDMTSGLIGYGQFPFDFASKPTTDGVVMQFNAFGRVGTLQPGLDQGRVCVHEIGHWLNLRHIWGDANCGSDFVDDTPPQRTFNRNCPSFPSLSSCSGNGTNGDMFMNYMDYTNNGCQNIYTAGQSLRMRAVFSAGGPRAAFINNYFSITKPTSFCNSGNVTVNNPMCLPVSWSVVSGNATITGGQNTNTVSIQANDNGTFKLRAEAAGYFDEIDIDYGIPYFEVPIFTNTADEGPYFCTSYSGNTFTPTFSFMPDNSGVQYRLLQYPNLNIVYSDPNIYPLGAPISVGSNYTPGYYVLDMKLTTPCGTSDWVGYEVEFVNCSVGGGGGEEYFRVKASPNPTVSDLTVELIDQSAKSQKLNKSEKIDYKLYNFNQTNLVKQWTFDNSQNRRLLNVAGLKTGIYILVVTKGKHRESTQIIIK